MAKHCISCKREITKGQKECYICGASQNVFRYYAKTCIVFVLFLSASAVLGYQYSEQKVQKIVQNASDLLEARVALSKDKIIVLEQQLAQAHQKVKETEVLLNQSTSNALGVSDEVAQVKLKVDEAQQKLVKAESRANWLSRENGRQKAKIKELNEIISTTNTVTNSVDIAPVEQLTTQAEPEALTTTKVDDNENPPILPTGDE